MEYVPTLQDLLGIFIAGVGVGVIACSFGKRVSDTHPKDGDVKQAPLVSGAGRNGNAQTSPPSNKELEQ